MTLSFEALKSASSFGSVTPLKAAGTSFWKKLMMPGICSSAISV